MKPVEEKWEWTPPALPVRRKQVYAVMAVLTAVAVYVALAGEVRLGSRADEGYEDYLPAMSEAVESLEATEARVLGEGYQVAQTWTEIQVPSGERREVTIAVEADASYAMLARGAVGCDTDLMLTEDIQDVSFGADARIEFSAARPAEVAVGIAAASPELSTCAVSYALYRR